MQVEVDFASLFADRWCLLMHLSGLHFLSETVFFCLQVRIIIVPSKIYFTKTMIMPL